MKLFCEHDYEIIKEFEIKSPMQKLVEGGLTSFERASFYMFNSKYIIIYKCKKQTKKQNVFIIIF